MPAPRPRFSRNGHCYSPATYSAWTKDALAQLGPLTPLDGPLAVAIDIAAERPKSTVLPAPRGDVDNFGKAVMDALTKARAWVDDSQVTLLAIKKRWASPGEIIGASIWISPATV